MQSKRAQSLVVAGLISGAAICARPASSDCLPTYEVTDFLMSVDCNPPFAPQTITPRDLNDVEHACGHYMDCFDPKLSRAVFWSPATGVVTLAHPPGYTTSMAIGMNDLDQVCGHLWTGWNGVPSATGKAFIWKDGEYTFIDPPRGWRASQAVEINNAGQVAGNLIEFGEANPTNAFVWADGVMTIIEPTFGERAIAVDINEAGTVAGRMGGSNNAHLFTWQAGKIVDHGVPPTWNAVQPRAIADDGTIVGYMDRANADRTITRHAFSYDGTTWTDLGLLEGHERSMAWSVNSGGMIGGECFQPGNVATLWINGELHVLSDLVLGGKDISISAVRGINECGHLFVDFTSLTIESGAAVLTPIPLHAADLDCSHIIDQADLSILLTEWNKSDSPADLNVDNVVDGADLGILLGEWSTPD